jgi:hypothetical protein
VTWFLQVANARIASDTFARIALDLMPGKISAASTPMIMTTIMISTMVKPVCLFPLRIAPICPVFEPHQDIRTDTPDRLQALCQTICSSLNL